MAYHSKYSGAEVDSLLDKIKADDVGSIDSSLSTTSANPVQNKVITEELNKKVNKTSIATINGQTLTDGGNIEVSTDAYDDTEIKGKLTELSLKVGKFSEITPTLSSGVQIATLKKEVKGEVVETPLYAPNGSGESGTWEDLGEIELTAFRTDIALLKDYRKILVQVTRTVELSSVTNISPSWRRIGGQSAFGHPTINLQSYNFAEMLMENDGIFVYAQIWANNFEANYSAVIGHTKHINIAQEKFDAFSITSSHFESLAGQKFHIYGMK